jgi:hypothetical protein
MYTVKNPGAVGYQGLAGKISRGSPFWTFIAFL